MKIRINTKIIKNLMPCIERLENWMKHYPNFNGNIISFLRLKNITPSDKIWVSIRLLPGQLLEVFSIDCAFAAEKYATNLVANGAAYDSAACTVSAASSRTAADAITFYPIRTASFVASSCAIVANSVTHTTACAADNAANAERDNEIEALIYLIKSEVI